MILISCPKGLDLSIPLDLDIDIDLDIHILLITRIFRINAAIIIWSLRIVWIQMGVRAPGLSAVNTGILIYFCCLIVLILLLLLL